MSLPTSKPAQSSIRSFFQAQGPKYAPPPSQKNKASNTSNPAPPALLATANTSPPSSWATQPSSNGTSAPSTNLRPNLPREAAVRPVTADDIPSLRRINALLLPVSYSDAFYRRVVEPATSSRLSRVITWAHDGEEPKVVGGVICSVEPAIETKTVGQIPQNLYIQSLCLLSPYRSKGLITTAVDDIIAYAVSDPRLDVRTATAHVWTENEEGLTWYASHGFRRIEPPIRGYYLKLRPDTAIVVRRDITASASAILSAVAVANGTSVSAPPKDDIASASRPPPRTGGQSYQNQRPETEWNDLPADMAPGRLAPPLRGDSEPGSGTSSRSSSSARKKRDRSYPAAAFGS